MPPPAAFLLPLPTALARPDARVSGEAQALGEAFFAWVAGGPGGEEALADERAAHARAVLPAEPINEAEASHDAYFRVARVQGDAARLMVGGAANAAWLLVGEAQAAPTRVASQRLLQTVDALVGMAAQVLAQPQPAGRQGVAAALAQRPAGAVEPLRRWIGGHQVFAALTQGLIDALARLSAAIWQPAGPAITSLAPAVGHLVSLLEAAATMLEFTGDFDAGAYEAVIRPTMMPPHVPASFSGLMSADHRVFVARLRDMAPELETLRRAAPELHARLHRAMASVYDSHRFVCERFVGAAPSLLRGGEAPSGAAQIDKFKAARLRVFEPPAVAAHPAQADAPAAAPPAPHSP